MGNRLKRDGERSVRGLKGSLGRVEDVEDVEDVENVEVGIGIGIAVSPLSGLTRDLDFDFNFDFDFDFDCGVADVLRPGGFWNGLLLSRDEGAEMTSPKLREERRGRSFRRTRNCIVKAGHSQYVVLRYVYDGGVEGEFSDFSKQKTTQKYFNRLWVKAKRDNRQKQETKSFTLTGVLMKILKPMLENGGELKTMTL